MPHSHAVFISEIYESFQGEGPFAETPSLFIRTSGCNLRCSFCDTPYTSWEPEGEQISLREISGRIEATAVEHVVLTGGEPMLAPQLTELSEVCRNLGKVITIETAGTVDRSVECDLMAISPKMSNSVPETPQWSRRHEETRFQPAVIESLVTRYSSILKFVIDAESDVTEVAEYLQGFPMIDASQIWLMAQATESAALQQKAPMVKAAAEKFGYQYSPRLHVERFGSQRGV